MASSAASLACMMCGGSCRSGGVDAWKDGVGRSFAVKYETTLRVFESMELDSEGILLGGMRGVLDSYYWVSGIQ